MYDAQWDLRGFDAVTKRLRGLPDAAQGKAGRAALRAAAVVVQKDAQARARQFDDMTTPSAIYKNIAVRYAPKIAKREGGIAFRVGVIGGAGVSKKKKSGTVLSGPGGDTRHWFYKEFGTEKQPAAPFMRPALESNIDKVIEVFGSNLEAQITKQLAKGSP